MFLVLKSSNPDFSYTICKNPHSPPRLLPIRKGVSIGYYFDANTYCIKFTDDNDEISYPAYKNQEFEYLTNTKFSSALSYYNNITDYFKLDINHDVDAEYELVFANFHISDRLLSVFQRIYTDFDLSSKDIWMNERIVTIKHTGKLEKLIKFATIFSFFVALDESPLYVAEEMTKKIVDLMLELDSPYFIRYLFKTQLLKSKNSFEKFKDPINSSDRWKFNIDRLNNYDSRKEFVYKNVKGRNVLDLGCGEGNFYKLLKNDCQYLGYDRDQDLVDLCIKRHGEFFTNELPDIVDTLILSEVIEHNTQDDLNILVDYINRVKPKKIVITTPNKDFNEYYQIENRHDDHQFEFTELEFINWINHLTEYESEVFGIGDSVNGTYTTLGAVCLLN